MDPALVRVDLLSPIKKLRGAERAIFVMRRGDYDHHPPEMLQHRRSHVRRVRCGVISSHLPRAGGLACVASELRFWWAYVAGSGAVVPMASITVRSVRSADPRLVLGDTLGCCHVEVVPDDGWIDVWGQFILAVRCMRGIEHAQRCIEVCCRVKTQTGLEDLVARTVICKEHNLSYGQFVDGERARSFSKFAVHRHRDAIYILHPKLCHTKRRPDVWEMKLPNQQLVKIRKRRKNGNNDHLQEFLISSIDSIRDEELRVALRKMCYETVCIFSAGRAR